MRGTPPPDDFVILVASPENDPEKSRLLAERRHCKTLAKNTLGF
jgi:hypothetical protein